jgi:hypothetical protein
LPIDDDKTDYKIMYKNFAKNAYPYMNYSSSNGNNSDNAGEIIVSRKSLPNVRQFKYWNILNLHNGAEPSVALGCRVFRTDFKGLKLF